MKIFRGARAGTLALGTCLVLLAGVGAPTISPAGAAEQNAQAESQYSEQELRSYAFAAAGVRLVQGSLDRQTVEIGDNRQAAQQLEREAQEQMTAAIERAGLTTESYDRMTQEIAADAQLTGTVQGYVDEEMGIVRFGD